LRYGEIHLRFPSDGKPPLISLGSTSSVMNIDRGSILFLFVLAALRFAAAAESPTFCCFFFTVFRDATETGEEAAFLPLGALLVCRVGRVALGFRCIDSSVDVEVIEGSTQTTYTSPLRTTFTVLLFSMAICFANTVASEYVVNVCSAIESSNVI
jgi:hypothetical protein